MLYNLNPIPNPNPIEKWIIFARLQFSRALVTWPPKISFSPITLQSCIFPYVMWGDSESASKNTSEPIKFLQKSKILKFKKSLASEFPLVRARNIVISWYII